MFVEFFDFDFDGEDAVGTGGFLVEVGFSDLEKGERR